MEHYNVQADEVVLYKGDVICKGVSFSDHIELVLTNLFLLFVIKTKKIFSKTEVNVEKYPVSNIKFYNDEPQVKQQGANVEIYLLEGEETVTFLSRAEANKFVTALMDLLTGKTKLQRTVDKAKATVDAMDNTLGINTVGTVKNIFEIGGSIAEIFTGKTGKTIKKVAGATRDIAGAVVQKGSEEDQQMEQLKKWKGLLDQGLISQEEFDIKRKEILGL